MPRTKCKKGHPFEDGSYRQGADGRRICLICKPETVCSVEDCTTHVHSKGYCQRHYRLLQKYGTPENKPLDQYARRGPKIDPSKPRSKAHGGLALTCHKGHVFTPENTYYLSTGKRGCKTCKEERATGKCKHGHLLTPENTFVRKDGIKTCRECNRLAMARFRQSPNYQKEPLKTHCNKGHEFTEENTLYGRGGKNRICVTCRVKDAERRARDREDRPHCPQGHEFTSDSWYLDLYGNKVCRPCRKEVALRKRLRDYGISAEQYLLLEERQDHKCAICRRNFSDLKKNPAIDHFHDCCPRGGSCGKCVRGLLCKDCNTALGLMQDLPERLLEAAQYLLDADKFRFRDQRLNRI